MKTKIKISDDQTNIDNYRLALNITEYHIISKLILPRIVIPKFMNIRQLFHVKNVCKSVKRTYPNYRKLSFLKTFLHKRLVNP